MSTIQIVSLLFLVFGIGGGYAIGIWGVKRLKEAEDNETNNEN